MASESRQGQTAQAASMSMESTSIFPSEFARLAERSQSSHGEDGTDKNEIIQTKEPQTTKAKKRAALSYPNELTHVVKMIRSGDICREDVDPSLIQWFSSLDKKSIVDLLDTCIEFSYQLEDPTRLPWSDKEMLQAAWKYCRENSLTQGTESMGQKIILFLVMAFAESTLKAQNIADKFNIDIAAILQESLPGSLQGRSLNTNGNASADDAIEAHVTPAIGRTTQLVYPMKKPRGYCLIINNMIFEAQGQSKGTTRNGTDIDRDRLTRLFHKKSFIIEVAENCTDTKMTEVINQLAEDINQLASKNPSDYDCFVCFILTHGIRGAVYGTNWGRVPLCKLISPFFAEACPSLAGKPKLFFLQACQGNGTQGDDHVSVCDVLSRPSPQPSTGLPVTSELSPSSCYQGSQDPEALDTQSDVNLEKDVQPAEIVFNEPDILIGFASQPGFDSYRSKTEGSWYIGSLTRMLQKYPDLDIRDILNLVSEEVRQKEGWIKGKFCKQTPTYKHTLQKKLEL